MSKRLLVAEDSKTIQKVIGLCLPGEDYQITSALSADEALSQVRQAAPDLVLIDGRMRGKDGYALCREMRSAGLEKAPIVLLHSAFEGVDEAAMRAAGFNAALAKPFDFESLHQVLATAAVDAPAAPAAAEPVAAPPQAVVEEEEVEFDLDLEPSTTEDAPLTAGPLAEEAEDEMFTLDVEEPVDLAGAEAEPLEWGSAADEEGLAAEEPVDLGGEETAQAWPDLAFDEEELVEEAPVTALELEGDESEVSADMLDTEEDTSLVLETAEDDELPRVDEQPEEDVFVDEDAIEPPVAMEEPAPTAAEEFAVGEDILDLTEDDVLELDEDDIVVQEAWEEEPATLGVVASEEMADEEPLMQAEETEEAGVSVDEAFDRFDDELVATIGAEDTEVDFATPVMAGTPETAPLPGAPAATTAELEQQLRALPEEEMRALLEKVARPLLERIAWEVVPDLAESLIREEIRKIKETAA